MPLFRNLRPKLDKADQGRNCQRVMVPPYPIFYKFVSQGFLMPLFLNLRSEVKLLTQYGTFFFKLESHSHCDVSCASDASYDSCVAVDHWWLSDADEARDVGAGKVSPNDEVDEVWVWWTQCCNTSRPEPAAQDEDGTCVEAVCKVEGVSRRWWHSATRSRQPQGCLHPKRRQFSERRSGGVVLWWPWVTLRARVPWARNLGPTTHRRSCRWGRSSQVHRSRQRPQLWRQVVFVFCRVLLAILRPHVGSGSRGWDGGRLGLDSG